MNDNFFEMLMSFFEKSLAQIKEKNLQQQRSNAVNVEQEEGPDLFDLEKQTLTLKTAKQNAVRVITQDEALKFTKASHQFLVRLMQLEFIPSEILEQIITQLLFSDSRFVTLQETKWAIRQSFIEHMDSAQLAFLDMVLYQKEDGITLH